MTESKTDEAEKPPALRKLPPIVEIFGAGRDPLTRHLRRASRFKRKAFRIGGEHMVRPGRSFTMSLHVARKHGAEIVQHIAEGTLSVRQYGKAFSLDEVRAGLLTAGVFAAWRWEELLAKYRDITEALGEGPSPEQLMEAVKAFDGYDGYKQAEAIAQLQHRIDEAQAALDASESSQEPETTTETTEDGEDEETASGDDLDSTEGSEPEDLEPGEVDPEAYTAALEAGAIEEASEEMEEETEDEGETEEMDEPKRQAVPASYRLPEGYEKYVKDDLFELYAEREDFALELPDDTRNAALAEHLGKWAENVFFTED